MYEYIWLVYALIAMIARGINSFFLKMYSSRNYNKNLIITYNVFWEFTFAAIFFLIFNLNSIKFSFTLNEITLIFFVSIFMVIGKKFVLTALDHLSSSVFFINSRIFTSISIIILSMIFLNEYLTLKQFLGIIFGIIVFLLLFEKHDKPKKNSNFKIGLIFLALVIVTFSYLNIAHKLVMQTIHLPFYLFIIYTGNLIISQILYYKSVKRKIFKLKEHISELKLTFISSLMQFIAVLTLFKAYLIQNVSIVYKIFSFEIFIPIILSILIYKEKLTLRKGIALGFTILSILFFI